MFYNIRNDKLNLVADYKFSNDAIETDIITYEDYKKYPNKVILQDGILVLNPNFDEEEAQKREAEFKDTFFNIENYGWYRRIPKGYTSAVESINSLKLWYGTTGVPQGVIMFYTAPDFTKPEQCTEEWLVEHSYFADAMTAEELDDFGRAFMTAWNYEEHEREINQGV